MALLGSADFDPKAADDATLRLGPGGAAPIAVRGRRDLNGDGHCDRTAWFRIPDTGIALGDTEVCLSGATADGDEFDGCAPIDTIEGCGRGHEVALVLPLFGAAFAVRRRRQSQRASSRPERSDARRPLRTSRRQTSRR